MPTASKRLMDRIHKRNILIKWMRKHNFEDRTVRNLIDLTIDSTSEPFLYMKQHVVQLALTVNRASRADLTLCTAWLRELDKGHIYHAGDWWRRFAIPSDKLTRLLKCYELWCYLRLMRKRRQNFVDPLTGGLTPKDRLTMRLYQHNLQQDVGESAEMR